MARAQILKWPENAEGQTRVIARATGLILAGEVVAFPTDTVYGIGACAWNEEAVRKLFAIKERPEAKAIALLLSGRAHLAQVTGYTSPEMNELARRFWPGGLTLVVPWRAELAAEREDRSGTVGVRVPDHPIPLVLIEAVGSPLATTSANLSGRASPVSAEDVDRQIGDRIALIVDGGQCPGGRDSTVVDLTTQPATVRRVGAVPVEALAEVLGEVRVEDSTA